MKKNVYINHRDIQNIFKPFLETTANTEPSEFLLRSQETMTKDRTAPLRIMANHIQPKTLGFVAKSQTPSTGFAKSRKVFWWFWSNDAHHKAYHKGRPVCIVLSKRVKSCEVASSKSVPLVTQPLVIRNRSPLGPSKACEVGVFSTQAPHLFFAGYPTWKPPTDSTRLLFG